MDMAGLLKKAQAMQAKVSEAQAQLEREEVTGTASGGAVTIIMTGKKIIKDIQISDDAMDDKDMLQDLIIAAANDAFEKVEALGEKMMGAATAGMPLPKF